MRRTVTFLMATAMATTACGSAAGNGYAPPFVTLKGTITTTGAVKTLSTVRVALVWKLASSSSSAPSSFRAVQELDVRAEFPVGFDLDVRTLPPPEAMAPTASGQAVPQGFATAYAFGTLVVYEDTNGNGKLDLLSEDGTMPVDHVLGIPKGLEIVYLEGGRIPKNPNALPGDEDVLDHDPGFNLIVEPARVLEPGCSSCNAPVGSWTKLPLDGALDIELTQDPRLARALCATAGADAVTSTGGCQPCIGAACASCAIPAGAAVKCSDDRTAFVARACASASVCGGLTCETVSGRRDAGSPAPSGWPCP